MFYIFAGTLFTKRSRSPDFKSVDTKPFFVKAVTQIVEMEDELGAVCDVGDGAPTLFAHTISARAANAKD